MKKAKPSLRVNGRDYLMPSRPAVVICLDGCEPAYLDAAVERGLAPTVERFRKEGTRRLAHSAMPSFTNPNNLSIATGRPPSEHGICGNYFLDPETGEEVMMNHVRFLRAPTLFSAFHEAGAKVAAITAKDKLRALLGAGLRFDEGRAICFSSERADQATLAENGIDDASAWLGRPVPEVYSAELSEFVFAAGAKLLREWKPDLLYLSTTDFIQHKAAPEEEEALRFNAMFDRWLAELDATGAVIVLTADHGMKPKHKPDGTPSAIYLQDSLDEWLGEGKARVILPITDPYVAHHGSLGSFATVYLPDGVDRRSVGERIASLEGIVEASEKEEAARRYELPEDRIGDLIVISGENFAIGTSASRHDLSALRGKLRSHGGLSEQAVPFLSNRRMEIPSAPQLRNFDAFLYALRAAAEA